MHKLRPNLIEELQYDIRDATNDDYYIPPTLKDKCKVINIKITKKLCDMLSCNPARNQSMCTPNTPAEIYRLGDTDKWDVHCQPACFNTVRKSTYDTSGTRTPDTQMMNYHNGECRIVPVSIITYLEKPRFRSDILYEMRKNDMPTGFTRIPSEEKYGSGFKYENNETYCKYFDRTLNEDKSCTYKWYEIGLDAVIGMSLINSTRSAARTLVTGKPFDIPSNLPELPKTVPEIYTVAGWKQHRNEEFILPTIINTRSNQKPEMKRRNRRSLPKTDNKSASISMAISEFGISLKKMFTALLESMLTNPTIMAQFGINLLTDIAITNFKSMLKGLIETLTKYSTRELLNLTGSIGSKILSNSIRGISTRFVTMTAVKSLSSMAVYGAKVAAAATSVVGWVLLGSMFLDIMFSFWDPYGYNNLFPPTMANDMMASAERALRAETGLESPSFQFEHLCGLLLTEEEIITIEVSSLEDRAIYLDALIVNNEGQVIDKGVPLVFKDINKDHIRDIQTITTSERIAIDSDSFLAYNHNFQHKVNNHAIINKIACSMLFMSLALFTTRFKILAIFLLIVVSVLFAINTYTILTPYKNGIKNYLDNYVI